MIQMLVKKLHVLCCNALNEINEFNEAEFYYQTALWKIIKVSDIATLSKCNFNFVMHQTLISLKGTRLKLEWAVINFCEAGLIFCRIKKQDSETGNRIFSRIVEPTHWMQLFTMSRDHLTMEYTLGRMQLVAIVCRIFILNKVGQFSLFRQATLEYIKCPVNLHQVGQKTILLRLKHCLCEVCELWKLANLLPTHN